MQGHRGVALGPVIPWRGAVRCLHRVGAVGTRCMVSVSCVGSPGRHNSNVCRDPRCVVGVPVLRGSWIILRGVPVACGGPRGVSRGVPVVCVGTPEAGRCAVEGAQPRPVCPSAGLRLWWGLRVGFWAPAVTGPRAVAAAQEAASAGWGSGTPPPPPRSRLPAGGAKRSRTGLNPRRAGTSGAEQARVLGGPAREEPSRAESQTGGAERSRGGPSPGRSGPSTAEWV